LLKQKVAQKVAIILGLSKNYNEPPKVAQLAKNDSYDFGHTQSCS
jgi:hypothetical protein